ncbi:hypothetical protein PAEPH01_1606 [Pancytospora epiphaga]|nr:hypothetical protein PAEPH01_1606 [Pancytospora epiphaga]
MKGYTIIHLSLYTKYEIKTHTCVRSHSAQEIVANENVQIRVDTRLWMAIKVDANLPNIFVHDKKEF